MSIERRLRELIERHILPSGGECPVPLDDLRNVLEPGSVHYYPADFGHAATCSSCMPDGDGRSFRRGRTA